VSGQSVSFGMRPYRKAAAECATGSLGGTELSCASTTMMVVIFTTCSTFRPTLQQMYGLCHTCQHRPNASAPPSWVRSLQAMLQEGGSGKTSTLAPPCNDENMAVPPK
jgi:hypothetical protein